MAPWSVLDALEIVAASRDERTALAQMLERITETSRETVPRTDFASVVIWFSDGHLEPFASRRPLRSPADFVLARADAVQCAQREGPAYDVVTRARVVSSPDVARDVRWPEYGPHAGALGVRSQLSVRVHDGRRARVGLNLYSRDRSAYRHPLEASTVLVDYAAGLLTSLGDLRRVRRAVAGPPGLTWADGAGGRDCGEQGTQRPRLFSVTGPGEGGRSPYPPRTAADGAATGRARARRRP
jgi:hypothetical protein